MKPDVYVKVESCGGRHLNSSATGHWFGPPYEKIVTLKSLHNELSDKEFGILVKTGRLADHTYFNENWDLEIIE